MPRNFKLKGTRANDPRVLMRAIIGALLVANLAAAIVAFKPFGGSAEDLRAEQQARSAQLSQLQARLAASRRLVDKVQTARHAGDGFQAQYFMDEGTSSAVLLAELTEAASGAGVTRMGTVQFAREEIEGSGTLEMLTAQVGFEGTYANLTKFVNLLDRSPRFFIIESMTAAAPQQQGGQALSVTLKINTFIQASPGTGVAAL